MTKKNSSLDHAKHNYNLFLLLKENGNFNDWLITTSFYAGIKYLQHSLFPGDFICPAENKVKRFNTFSSYINANRKLNKANAHRLLENVINTYVEDDEVINSYKDLKDASFHARYINYNVGKQRVQMCEEAIDTIKQYSAPE